MIKKINRQVLMQINALQKAQQRVIELSVREAQLNTSSEVHQHLSTLIGLRSSQAKGSLKQPHHMKIQRPQSRSLMEADERALISVTVPVINNLNLT